MYQSIVCFYTCTIMFYMYVASGTYMYYVRISLSRSNRL